MPPAQICFREQEVQEHQFTTDEVFQGELWTHFFQGFVCESVTNVLAYIHFALPIRFHSIRRDANEAVQVVLRW